MFTSSRASALTLGAVLLCMVLPQFADAHPMGNFSINHYANVRVERGEVRIRYRLDLAEIPTAQEMPTLDADGDGHVSDAERYAYLAKNSPRLLDGLHLRIDGHDVRLSLISGNVQLRPGAADLPTTLITMECRAPIGTAPPPIGSRHRIHFLDDNYPERMGWREITARDAPGGEIVATDVPRYERSRGLEAYPADPSESPPQQRQAELDIRIVSAAGASAPAPAEHPAGPTAASTPRDRFTALIGVERLSLGVILPALAIAFGLGCFHALSPGHGKTVVAAYLVGSRGTPRHAVLLGLVVTATHVAGVFALGLAVLVASAYVLPERLYPWLGFVSGLMILMLGVWQFTRRYAVRYVRARGTTEAVFDEHGTETHVHDLPDRITPSALIALGISGGIVPCPSALIVMLGAVALGRTAFGLVLVVAFSIGLAAILVLIGLLMLYARRLVERLSWAPAALGRMPLISPVLVAAIGAVIAARSVLAGGLLTIK